MSFNNVSKHSFVEIELYKMSETEIHFFFNTYQYICLKQIFFEGPLQYHCGFLIYNFLVWTPEIWCEPIGAIMDPGCELLIYNIRSPSQHFIISCIIYFFLALLCDHAELSPCYKDVNNPTRGCEPITDTRKLTRTHIHTYIHT